MFILRKIFAFMMATVDGYYAVAPGAHSPLAALLE
jgi:hypothetical protein